MILDNELVLSDAQDLAGISAATASTNSIDLTAVERQIGTGQPLKVLANINTVLVSTGVTITITIQSDTTSAFPSAATILTLAPVVAADAAAGTKYEGYLPAGATACERWIRGVYTPSGGVTSGAIDLQIVLDTDAHRQGTSGWSVASS